MTSDAPTNERKHVKLNIACVRSRDGTEYSNIRKSTEYSNSILVSDFSAFLKIVTFSEQKSMFNLKMWNCTALTICKV